MQATAAHGDPRIGVLIAGIGAGSLGLEIYKSLRHAGPYRLIGTDISDKAYGLYGEKFDRTYLLPPSDGEAYAKCLLDICLKERIEAIAPGAEAVHRILAAHRALFESNAILPMINSQGVIDLCSDKVRSMEFLASEGIPVPETIESEPGRPVKFPKFPCVVKTSSASGGSNLVFVAEDETEAAFFVTYIAKRGHKALLQEYIISAEEFTVGVVNAPDGRTLSSIALRRFLDSKLSISARYEDRVISSGWSQGYIDDFPDVRRQAERIAACVGSTWALNIQGRLDKRGVFFPFEINPRHSGTTFLRTLAGLNEPHALLQQCLRNSSLAPGNMKSGYYLRGFAEKAVGPDEIRRHD